MISLDTNVLVRLLAEDDARQFNLARRLIEKSQRHQTPILITSVVLIETTWVLSRRFGLDRNGIAATVRLILGNGGLILENAKAVAAALDAYEAGPADFSDCFIAARAAELKADYTATFDKKAAKSSGFRLIK